MPDPDSTVDYPTYAGATGKRAILQALVANADNGAMIRAICYRISSTDLNDCTDKSTLYSATDVFTSARA